MKRVKESLRRSRSIARRMSAVWRNASRVQKGAIFLLLLGCIFCNSDDNKIND